MSFARLMILLLALLTTVPQHTLAAKTGLTDVQAKLAIIYNFIGRYVQWPGDYAIDQRNQVNICAVGSDELTREMAVLERASTPKLQVTVLQNVPYERLSGCHVLYIARSENHHFVRILRYIQNAPTLSFSSIENFIEQGGMISLVQETQTQGMFEKSFIRFDVNTRNVEKVKLFIDPDALELARRVIR